MQRACPSVRLSVCLSPKYKNAIFLKTKQFRAMVSMTTCRKSYTGFSKNPLLRSAILDLDAKMQKWQSFGRIKWHVIPEPPATLQGAATWRIEWHVIPEPRFTLQGRPTATWWIHCHDRRATCHIAGCSHLAKLMSWSCHIAGCKNSICHIDNRFSPYFVFLCLMEFGLWRATAFVSSPRPFTW